VAKARHGLSTCRVRTAGSQYDGTENTRLRRSERQMRMAIGLAKNGYTAQTPVSALLSLIQQTPEK